ncbi:RNA ligase [Bifidobacterium italicum]|uniref:RNA ligase n=2 Tax=Bifidobacterium italicum TaxID=1960968 RepID=A0A2A2EHR3_9BIFI|nr:RNA ligase [Bifidobacterium italicum]
MVRMRGAYGPPDVVGARGDGITVTTQDKLKAYCREHNATLLLEVCDKAHDKHIIEYPKTTAYLLDAVRNSFEFQELCDYDELAALAESLGVPVKERVTVLGDEDAARAFVADIIRDDYTDRGEHIEGFVFTVADGHILKEFHSGRAWPEDADARIDDAAATDASDAKAFDSDDLIRLRNAYQAPQGMSAGRNQ